jgi:hypothetical protein
MSDEMKAKKRGFATWSKEDLMKAATKGGRAAHAAGTAHEFSSEEARTAGRKGAEVSHARRRAKLALEAKA